MISLWKAHSAQQTVKTRVLSQLIEQRIDLEQNHHVVSFIQSLFEQRERPVSFSKRAV
jgi:hypothetical protein